MPQNEQNDNNKKAIRALVLTTSYPLGPGDSSSIFLKYLCEHLHRQGVDVHVLAPASSGGGAVLEDGIHVHRFRYMFGPWQRLAYGSGILSNLKQQPLLWLVLPFFLVSFLVAALAVTRSVRPNVLHGHWIIPTGLVALLTGKLFRRPVVLTAHGGDAFALKSGLLSRLKKFIVRHVSAWTANTKATANAILPDASKNGCVVVPMGVDTDVFNSISSGNQRTNDMRRVLFVGRLVEEKGVIHLLRAISLLPEGAKSRIQVDIVGEGTEKSVLIDEANKLGINSLVNFIGRVPNDELPVFFQRADVFVGPSLFEGQGIVFLEAMACGLPVIASDVGGISEIIQSGENGVLVPPGDANKLSIALNELLFDDARQSSIAENGLRVIKTRYTWDSVSRQFLELYESAAE